MITIKTLGAGLGVALLGLVTACSSASTTPVEPAAPAVPAVQSIPEEPERPVIVQPSATASVPTPLPAVAKQASTTIGYEIGNRVAGFEMRVDDGTTVTSDELISRGKPVFLFFMATW